MNKKEGELQQKKEGTPQSTVPVSIDLGDSYSFDSKEAELDISDTKYSNYAVIHVSERDVHVDFLEMPGLKREGKRNVKGTRIYMSHVAAQRLAEVLGNILETVYSSGRMEEYRSKKGDKQDLTKSD